MIILEGYEGVKVPVKEFIEEIKEAIAPFPVGDQISVAIQKSVRTD